MNKTTTIKIDNTTNGDNANESNNTTKGNNIIERSIIKSLSTTSKGR